MLVLLIFLALAMNSMVRLARSWLMVGMSLMKMTNSGVTIP